MPPRELTERELEVARLVAEGWTTKRIAFRLGISDRRVRVLITAVAVWIRVPDGGDDRVHVALWYARTFGVAA